jgi:uncharacterized protein YggE
MQNNKTIKFLLLCLLFGFLFVELVKDITKPNEIRKINVSGECLTSVPKDRTAITLRVTTLDNNAAVSMKKATEKMAAITDYLKTIDVKMQTTEFDSHEKTRWNRALEQEENLGIETNIAVEVSAKNSEIISDILNKYAGQDDVFTNNLRMFTSSETLKPAMEKCLGIAVQDARKRANALVADDKLKVGKLLSVSYGDVSYDERPYANYRMMAIETASAKMADFDTGGSIVGKDTEITVKVSATFEIK